MLLACLGKKLCPYAFAVFVPLSLPPPLSFTSLASRFKMRADIQTYHLGGMGCGTGVVGINLIRDLLKVWGGVGRCGRARKCGKVNTGCWYGVGVNVPRP